MFWRCSQETAGHAIVLNSLGVLTSIATYRDTSAQIV
jgi:hypothetical protein